jgi:APA family basic amino acid/polyamine antiporter
MKTPSLTPSPAAGLHQVLGVAFGVAVIIGNTIGAGILRTPGDVASQLPNGWLFIGVWLLGGAWVFLGSLCLAELGTLLPESGGQYVFARTALGEYAGFIVGWSDWISTCGTTASVALVVAEYSGSLIPPLARRSMAVALSVTIGFALLQWRGIRWGSRTQQITALLKTLAFLAIVTACFLVAPARSGATTLRPASTLLVGMIIALQAVIYTYDGWAGVIYFSEEVRDGPRNIPRSLFAGVFAIIAIYLAVNLALLYVLPISRIAGQGLALGAAAGAVFGAWGDPIVRTLMVVSMISAINADHLMATRVLFAMSRDGLVHRRVSAVNAGGTPALALGLSAAVAVVFILSGTFDEVIAVLAFFFVANYTLSFASLFILRRKLPHAPRPYRVWGYPWTPGVALAGSLAFLAGAIAGDTRRSLYAMALLAASYPAYRLLRRVAFRHPDQASIR